MAENAVTGLRECNNYYKYFPQEIPPEKAELYKKFYTLCSFRTSVIEDAEDKMATSNRAYKMAVLFNSVEELENFVNSNSSNLKKVFHDLFVKTELPICKESGKRDFLEPWKAIINKKVSHKKAILH